MHSSVRNSPTGMNWNLANVATTILLALFSLIFLFLLLTVTAPPAQAQSSVPPTAVQAARMPPFASRLHAAPNASRLRPSTRPRASYKNPADPRARRGASLDSNDIYDNGPTNGTTDAWTINFGFAVSDSFPLAANGTVNGLNFAAWVLPGDVLQSVEVAIASAAFGGTTYFDQTLNVTASSCVSNQYGYNVCTASVTFSDVPLNAGSYWVTLQNALVNTGDPVYWDENSGPSSAQDNSIGTIPSESFTILGGTTTTSTSYNDNYACPPEQLGWEDLHTLNTESAGVALDAAGNLYGSTTGGAHGEGMLYKVAERAGHWFFSSLYSFLGGSEGGDPGKVIVAPDGALYGSAGGGIQNCGDDRSLYCGVIYKVNPRPTQCASALCSWNESPVYQFSGNTDSWGGSIVAFDRAGNLYGYSSSGGARGRGAVFELTPAQGSWTEQILYNFTGAVDGSAPSSLLLGQDGALYGTTTYGGLSNHGAVFRLSRQGAAWTETILYSFTGTTDGFSPAGLVQDPSGNLVGFNTCYNDYEHLYCGGGYLTDSYGLLFMLHPVTTGWNFSLLYNTINNCNWNSDKYHAIAFDAQGVLYTAEGGVDESCDPTGCYTSYCGMITTWGSSPLISGNADIFQNLTSDASGHLYGTVTTCGGLGTPLRDKGMVWKLSHP